ncbi:MAG TPA: dihydropteroate synthase [Vicinamibacterales bacterium]|nr:dihydropteroate synthase [Vicinamibacterales bacterium]
MNRKFHPPRRLYDINLPGRGLLRLGERCLVMGVVNVTPDSFASSSLVDPEAAVAEALQLEADGADIIDVGGESTRPSASPVSAADELARVLPVVRGLANRLTIPLSIDTYKASVARGAVDAGAAIINDVSGLRVDPALAAVAASSGAALVLMHTRGGPQTMQNEAEYADLIVEIAAELRASIDAAVASGVPIDRIIADPGIGFAKRPRHSYGVLGQLPALAAALDRPLLVGPSRKSFMRHALADRPPKERDWGTAAAVTAAVLAGAHIVRVHAVKEMVQVVRVAEEIRCAGQEAEGLP